MLIPVTGSGIPFRRGMSDAISDAAQATSLGGSLASATVGAAVPAGLIAGSTASIAIPIIGVGVAAVMIALTLIRNSGCGQTCIVAANDANKIEPLLQANLNGYFAGPRTVASQQQALANFDQIWAALAEACGNPALGNAGKRCISDRQRGACVWRQTSASNIPGSVQPGECWNWFNGYRDPIANDPAVSAAPSLNSILGGDGAAGTFNAKSLLIPAALLGLLWVAS